MKKEQTKTENYTAVLLEEIRGEMKGLAEGISNLNEKMDRGFAEIREELGDFKKETCANFKAVFEYLSRIDDEISEIKSEIKDIRQEPDKKADVSRLDSLEERIKKLEMRQLVLRDEMKKS